MCVYIYIYIHTYLERDTYSLAVAHRLGFGGGRFLLDVCHVTSLMLSPRAAIDWHYHLICIRDY